MGGTTSPSLNLPNIEALLACENLLIAGMGGGFDIFCGLPIYFELLRLGRRPHLANLSFSRLEHLKNGTSLQGNPIGVTSESRTVALYFPEYHLVRWSVEQQEPMTVWCFHAAGGLPLLAAYRRLIAHLNIDGILLIDGGVDSLMRGNEDRLGTFLEDTLSLSAVAALNDVPFRQLACLGMGAEDDVGVAEALENIAALSATGAFLGSCSLTAAMESYRRYADAVEYVHRKRGQDPSVIQSSVLSAIEGHYSNYHRTEKTKGSRLYISPLMPLYWCFDLPQVAQQNNFVEPLRNTTSFIECLMVLTHGRERLKRRPRGTTAFP